MKNPSRVVLVAVLLATTGCASRDVRTDLEIVDVHSGYFDMGRVDQESIKIVPGISFRVRNKSKDAIAGVEINGVFRDLGKDAVIDEHYVKAIPFERPLDAGATSEPIVLRSRYGYTGTETRPQMLKNSSFVDKNITILGKHGRNNWAKMGTFSIERAPINR
jgi:hypothetical protein